MYAIPRYCDLDGVVEIRPLLEGVMLTSLEACDTIRARTRDSDYEIFLLDPKSGRAFVRSGVTNTAEAASQRVPDAGNALRNVVDVFAF